VVLKKNMTRDNSTHYNIKSLLERENGTIKKVFGTLPSVAICFPNSYYIGASNLGIHFLYDTINKREDFLSERFFTDFTPPVSLESQQSLNSFDIIIFSIAFELDFPSILKILNDAGIPCNREDRGKNYPLIIAGGTAVTMNPLPLHNFIDILVLGDGEETLPLILDSYIKENEDKTASLCALNGKPGFYIPGSGIENVQEKATCYDLNSHPIYSVFLSPDTEFSNTCLLEIGRGCPYKCNFCYIGHNKSPCRIRDINSIKMIINENRHRTNRFGLVSSAVTAHPDIEELCKWGIKEKLDISFSSLRADNLSPTILELLRKSGQKTLTLAPETGSETFRLSINKTLKNSHILETVKIALEKGFSNIRLYFIIGLPGESSVEIEASLDLIKSAREIMLEEGRKKGRIGEIIVSLSFFVPKPGTPLKDETMPDASVLKKRQQAILKGLKSIPHIKVLTANPHEAIAQARLSIGGIEQGDFLLNKIKRRLSWKAALKSYS
jgi:radical SAM superfamily enzyme YgiQ (UPF0313 family)